jgi:hypothetical protein
MYCGHCGNYMAEGSAVCPRCGTQTAEDASPASGASSWSSASGQTDDRMDPSAPSSWSQSGEPPTAQRPAWSAGSPPPSAQAPSWSPGGSQPTNPHGPGWSQDQQASPQSPSWSGGQQASPQPPTAQWSPGQQPSPQQPSPQPPTAQWSPGQQPSPQAPAWSAGQQGSPQGPSWQGQQAGGQAPAWSQGGQPPNAPGPAWSQGGGQVGTQSGSSAFNFDAKRWKRSDWIAGIASVVVLISLFLPWFNGSVSANNDVGLAVQTASESGTGGHGWLWLVFIVALLIVAFLVLMAGFQALPFKLPLPNDQVLLIAAGVNLVLIFIAFLLKPSTDGIAGVSITWGIGAYLDLVAAIVAVAVLTPPGRQRVDSRAS